MRYWIIVPLLLFSNLCLFGQGAKMIALGNCKATLSNGWSVINNPSGLTSINNFQFLVEYNQKYLIKDLGTRSIGMVLPTNGGNFGVAWMSSGFSVFKRNQLNFSYGILLEKKLSVGLKINYINFKYGESTSTFQYLSSSLGVQYLLTEKVQIGILANNISSIARKNNSRPNELKPGISFGVGYTASSRVLLMAELSKYLITPVDLKLGLEYEVVKKLLLRIGVYGSRLTHTLGVGYRLKHINIDIGGEKHPVLGYSLSCSLSVFLNKNPKK